MIHQTLLPFKLEVTRDTITSHAGSVLPAVINRSLSKAGSGAGYKASEYVFALVLMLNGGGRSLEDI